MDYLCKSIANYLPDRDVRSFLCVSAHAHAQERAIALETDVEVKLTLLGENDSRALVRAIKWKLQYIIPKYTFADACGKGHFSYARGLWKSSRGICALNLADAMYLACKNGQVYAIAFLLDLNTQYFAGWIPTSEDYPRNTMITHGFCGACAGGHIAILDILWNFARDDDRINFTRAFEYREEYRGMITEETLSWGSRRETFYNLGTEGYLKALLFAREDVIAHLDACGNKYGVIARDYCYARALRTILAVHSTLLARAFAHANLKYVPLREWPQIASYAMTRGSCVTRRVCDLMRNALPSVELDTILYSAATNQFARICEREDPCELRKFFALIARFSLRISRADLKIARHRAFTRAFAAAITSAM